MMIPILFFTICVGALAAFFIRDDNSRRRLLVAAALLHIVLTVFAWFDDTTYVFGLFGVDSLSRWFLTVTSFLFCAAAFYAKGYLKRQSHARQKDFEENLLFLDAPEPVFTGCLLLFLSCMTLAIFCRHFGMLWAAMEATTLATAPLIYFHRHHRSLEAVWKYLLICSVGIALALLGNLFLAAALKAEWGSGAQLFFRDLTSPSVHWNSAWLKAAFIFFLVGYGTKMGLSPMHTWLPDAHSEAPSVVSALLSGALLNCAFLAILRIHQVCVAAGIGVFSSQLLILFGLISMVTAAVFIVGQTDYKRMLAYSSIEHMGILALGAGLGPIAYFAVLLHILNHSFTKAALFFTAGNILGRYQTKEIAKVSGVLQELPVSGFLWLCGFLAITGMPPFGLFISEFLILKAGFDSGHIFAMIVYLAALAVIFMAMAYTFLNMAQGKSRLQPKASQPEARSAVLPALALCAVVFILGFYIPPQINDFLHKAAVSMEAPR